MRGESGRIGSGRVVRLVRKPGESDLLREYHPSAGGFWRQWSPVAAWAALILSILLATGALNPRPEKAPTPGTRELLLAKELGEGISILMIESYFAQVWSREYVLLDTLVTPDSMQSVVDQLEIILNVHLLTHNREQARRVPYGEPLPKSLYSSLEQRWGSLAVDAMDAAAKLQWLVWQDVMAGQTFGNMRETIREYYRKEYPRVARELNQRFEHLGMVERLEEQYNPNHEEVTKRCWELDLLLEEHLEGLPR